MTEPNLAGGFAAICMGIILGFLGVVIQLERIITLLNRCPQCGAKPEEIHAASCPHWVTP